MTVVSGMLDVVKFVHYCVFASKQTGENEAFYQRGSVVGHALTNNLRNVLFLAVYLFSHKDLRSKIEQNVSVSLLSYVRDNFIIVPIFTATKLIFTQFLHWLLCLRSLRTPVSAKEARMVAFYKPDTDWSDSCGESVELVRNAQRCYQCVCPGGRGAPGLGSIWTDQYSSDGRPGRAEYDYGHWCNRKCWRFCST